MEDSLQRIGALVAPALPEGIERRADLGGAAVIDQRFDGSSDLVEIVEDVPEEDILIRARRGDNCILLVDGIAGSVLQYQIALIVVQAEYLNGIGGQESSHVIKQYIHILAFWRDVLGLKVEGPDAGAQLLAMHDGAVGEARRIGAESLHLEVADDIFRSRINVQWEGQVAIIGVAIQHRGRSGLQDGRDVGGGIGLMSEYKKTGQEGREQESAKKRLIENIHLIRNDVSHMFYNYNISH